MVKTESLWLLFYFVMKTQSTFDKTVCSPATLTNPGPPLPIILPQFYVHVNCILVNKGRTITATEYFDNPGGRGVIKKIEDSNEMDIYYSYSTNELLTFIPSEGYCKADDLATDPNNMLLGYTLKNGSARIFSAARALHFDSSINQMYQGTERVRGIMADKWQSCQYWDAFNATMLVNWYFSSPNGWNTATGTSQIPLLCHITGKSTPKGQIAHSFEHYYEFMDFRPGLPHDQTVYETPRGALCEDRKITKRYPSLPDQMSFVSETVDKILLVVTFMEEEYDFLSKLARFSYTEIPFQNIYSQNPKVEVHDFRTGLRYITDVGTGACTIRPIGGNFVDTSQINSVNVRMKTAWELFNFSNKTYSYEGVKNVRGVNCDTWIGKKVGWPANNPDAESIWEWYFALSIYQEIIGPGTQKSSPLQTRVKAPMNNIDFDMNIFSFVENHPDPLSFDVSQCYLYKRREKVAFTITKDSKAVIVANIAKFKYITLAAIADAAKVVPLRIQNLQVKIDADYVLVTFEIVDVAPPIGDVNSKVPETPLAEALESFTNKLASSQFSISVKYPEFPNPIEIVPSPFKLLDVSYEEAKRSVRATRGAMAGLALGMLFVGSVSGSVVVYKLYNRNT